MARDSDGAPAEQLSAELAAELRQGISRAGRAAIVHDDYRLDNPILAVADPGRIAASIVFAEKGDFAYLPDKMKRFRRPENVRPVCKVEKVSGGYAKWGPGNEEEGASAPDGKRGTQPTR
jgi:hypothetical protein